MRRIRHSRRTATQESDAACQSDASATQEATQFRQSDAQVATQGEPGFAKRRRRATRRNSDAEPVAVATQLPSDAVSVATQLRSDAWLRATKLPGEPLHPSTMIDKRRAPPPVNHDRLIGVARALRRSWPCVAAKLRRYCHGFCVAVASRRSASLLGKSWFPCVATCASLLRNRVASCVADASLWQTASLSCVALRR